MTDPTTPKPEKKAPAYKNIADKLGEDIEKSNDSELLDFWNELGNGIQLAIAARQKYNDLDEVETKNLVRKLGYYERLNRLYKQSYELKLKELQIEGKGKSLYSKGKEGLYGFGRDLTRWYRSDTPHKIGMIVQKSIDTPIGMGRMLGQAIGRRRRKGDQEGGGEAIADAGGAVKGISGLAGGIGRKVGEAGKKVAGLAVGLASIFATRGASIGGVNAATGNVSSGGAPVAGVSNETKAIEAGSKRASKDAKETQVSLGESIGEATAGMLGSLGEIGQFLGIITSTIGKIWKIIEEASPFMQGMMKLIVKAITLFLMPIGNMIAIILRPLAKKMMLAAAKALKAGNAAAKEGGDLFGIVTNTLEPLFSELADVAVTIMVDILPDLLGGIGVALLDGLLTFFEKFAKAAPDFIEKVSNVIVRVIEGSSEIIKRALQTMATVILGFLTCAECKERFKNAIIKVGEAIVGFVEESGPAILQMMWDMAQVIVDFVNEHGPVVADMIVKISNSIITFINKPENQQTFNLLITTIATLFTNWITNNLYLLNNFLNAIAIAVGNWLASGDGIAAISYCFLSIFNALSGGMITKMYTFINGFWEGLRSAVKGMTFGLVDIGSLGGGNSYTYDPAWQYPNSTVAAQKRAQRGYAGGDTHFSPLNPQSIIVGEGTSGESVVTDPQLLGMLNTAIMTSLSAVGVAKGSGGQVKSNNTQNVVVNITGPIYGVDDLEKAITKVVYKLNKQAAWY